MCIEWRNGDLFLEVRVQPRASQDQIIGIVDARFKIKITAPPVDRAANRYLQQFLAGEFGVAKSHVEVVRGHHSRYKRVLVKKPKLNPQWFTQHEPLPELQSTTPSEPSRQ